ncbi:TetR/AcrR family transcriptional regulator [Antrihabitans cavernicola]|uniref:TetR/AcrR family transcriptional regulator n=1 Tax=Antrihabitans cavernicola TaxID=2495913 RepID=A0A5A7SCJ8_9NOCA|nr:TetR/AcrR family transcriptional regulator [Spelaeibacter cavernicola]KAA0022225.1 TetR/AcrR family transcriptional regulator [Spelaeibacter cavernicola]
MSQDSGGRTYAGQSVEDRQRERRARFVESGLTVFARDGYASSSVGAICKDAGLSSRQFYEEFNGREALLVELFDLIERDSREAVSNALTAAGELGFAQMIEACTRAYIESVGSDPRRARVCLVEAIGASPTMEKYRLQQRRLWAGLLQAVAEDAATHGDIPAGDYQMRVTAVLGAVNYVVYDWTIADPRPPMDDVIRVLGQTLIGAMGGRNPRAS